MPGLRLWIEREYSRLQADGKTDLVDAFKRFNAAYFEAHYAEALEAIPELYELTQYFREPSWEVLIAYYDASSSIYWRGELNRGLDAANRGLVQSVSNPAVDPIPAIYVREMLLYAWLEVDAVGYAPLVLATLEDIEAHDPSPDFKLRIAMLRARCRAAQGAIDEAINLTEALLPELDWPVAYHASLRGGLLRWQGRAEAAAQQYQRSIQGFEGLGYRIEANDSRLALGDTLLELGKPEAALETLQEASIHAEAGLNRAHRAMVQGLSAGAYYQQENYERARDGYQTALAMLDGLGWLRLEAEYGLALFHVQRVLGMEPGSEQWDTLEYETQLRVDRLKSDDLAQEFKTLV